MCRAKYSPERDGAGTSRLVYWQNSRSAFSFLKIALSFNFHAIFEQFCTPDLKKFDQMGVLRVRLIETTSATQYVKGKQI